MDPARMWVLSTGKKVEETLWRYSTDCQFEDTSHSFILDLDNKALLRHFTTEELEELKVKNKQPDLIFPAKLGDFLGEIASTSTAKAASKVARQGDFDDDDDDDDDDMNDCRWAQLAVIQAAGLFMKNGSIDFSVLSETDILHGPWRILFTCCACSMVTCQASEVTSTASGNSKNKDRETTMDNRYRLGAKVDGKYLGGSRELGWIEAGRSTKERSSKELADGYLKLPKTLKDMLVQLVKEEKIKPVTIATTTVDDDHDDDHERRNLMTVGFLVMAHKVQLLEMDWPAGYVARLTRSQPFYFPRLSAEFPRKFTTIIKLVWKALRRMEDTLEFIVNTNDKDVEVDGIQFTRNNNNNNNNTTTTTSNSASLIQPSFYPNSNNNSNKKRKTVFDT